MLEIRGLQPVVTQGVHDVSGKCDAVHDDLHLGVWVPLEFLGRAGVRYEINVGVHGVNRAKNAPAEGIIGEPIPRDHLGFEVDEAALLGIHGVVHRLHD